MITTKALNLIKKANPLNLLRKIFGFFSGNKKRTIILIVALLIAAALWFLFGLYQKTAQEQYSAIFHQSLIEEEKGDTKNALALLRTIYVAKFAPSGVKGLASLRYAHLLYINGSEDEALEIYKNIANGRRYNNYLRELSGLLATKIIVIKTDTNSDKPLQKEALKQIKKFESRSKIMKPYFSEQRGNFEMKLENFEAAYATFTEISQNQEAAQGLKLRAADMLKIISAQRSIAKK